MLAALGTALVLLAGWLAWPVAVHMTAKAILDANTVAVSKPAPAFTLTDAKGGRLSLADYRGKVVLLNFWATWCEPCRTEIPWFIEFENKYKDKGLAVLGVSMDVDGWKSVTPYVAAQNINYPIAVGDEKVNIAYGGIEALPMTLLINRSGKVAFIHSGLIPRAEYEAEIRQLLGRATIGDE